MSEELRGGIWGQRMWSVLISSYRERRRQRDCSVSYSTNAQTTYADPDVSPARELTRGIAFAITKSMTVVHIGAAFRSKLGVANNRFVKVMFPCPPPQPIPWIYGPLVVAPEKFFRPMGMESGK